MRFAYFDAANGCAFPIDKAAPMQYVRDELAKLSNMSALVSSDADYMQRIRLDDDLTLFYSVIDESRENAQFNRFIGIYEGGIQHMIGIYDTAYIVKTDGVTPVSMNADDLAYADLMVQSDLNIGKFLFVRPGRRPEPVQLPTIDAAFQRKLSAGAPLPGYQEQFGLPQSFAGNGQIDLTLLEAGHGDREVYIVSLRDEAKEQNAKTRYVKSVLLAAYHRAVRSFYPLDRYEIDRYSSIFSKDQSLIPYIHELNIPWRAIDKLLREARCPPYDPAKEPKPRRPMR